MSFRRVSFAAAVAAVAAAALIPGAASAGTPSTSETVTIDDAVRTIGGAVPDTGLGDGGHIVCFAFAAVDYTVCINGISP